MAKLEVDGKPVEVRDGAMVMEAANALGHHGAGHEGMDHSGGNSDSAKEGAH